MRWFILVRSLGFWFESAVMSRVAFRYLFNTWGHRVFVWRRLPLHSLARGGVSPSANPHNFSPFSLPTHLWLAFHALSRASSSVSSCCCCRRRVQIQQGPQKEPARAPPPRPQFYVSSRLQAVISESVQSTAAANTADGSHYNTTHKQPPSQRPQHTTSCPAVVYHSQCSRRHFVHSQ